MTMGSIPGHTATTNCSSKPQAKNVTHRLWTGKLWSQKMSSSERKWSSHTMGVIWKVILHFPTLWNVLKSFKHVELKPQFALAHFFTSSGQFILTHSIFLYQLKMENLQMFTVSEKDSDNQHRLCMDVKAVLDLGKTDAEGDSMNVSHNTENMV